MDIFWQKVEFRGLQDDLKNGINVPKFLIFELSCV